MLSIATSLITLVGMWLVGRKNWRGWLVGLVNQVLWLALIIQTHAWGLLILTVSLVYIYLRALIAWRRDDRVFRSTESAALGTPAQPD